MASGRSTLNQNSLDKLLTRLDGDRERAGEKYEVLRRGLERFFRWRSCTFFEEHADEVLDRIARRIDQGEVILDIHSYATGVARLLFKEILKEQLRDSGALNRLKAEPVNVNPLEEDHRLSAVRQCLQALSPESRQLLISYYGTEKQDKVGERRGLAQKMGISSHALTMKVLRLRGKIEECVDRAQRRAGKKTS
jgi:DNA-directed RNA polymerase specialized sigma24 family protein